MEKKIRQFSNFFQFFLKTHTDFEPKLTYIPRDELESATRQIRKEVEIINNTLTEEEKNELLTDVNNEDPMGYICDKSLMEIKELQYVDQLLCFNTTEEICYKVSISSKNSFVKRVQNFVTTRFFVFLQFMWSIF